MRHLVALLNTEMALPWAQPLLALRLDEVSNTVKRSRNLANAHRVHSFCLMFVPASATFGAFPWTVVQNLRTHQVLNTWLIPFPVLITRDVREADERPRGMCGVPLRCARQRLSLA